MATVSRNNLYHVPRKMWNEWSPAARAVFNLVFSTMRPNQSLFIHPKAAPAPKTHWQTVAWNAAWCAARAADGDVMTGETTLEGAPDANGELPVEGATVAGVMKHDKPSPVAA